MPKSATVNAPTAMEILADLEARGAEATRKIYARQGIVGSIFGVKLGELRALAKKLKTQHDLALSLWSSGAYEARVLAAMLLDPAKLTEAEAVSLTESADSPPVIDELTSETFEDSELAETLRAKWIDSPDPLLGRAGWNLMTAAVKRDKKGEIDLDALLAKIEAELLEAPKHKKEAINTCLAMIGVWHASHTAKAIAAGERLGRWDDRPVPKGCTSSYPPEWIPAAIALRNRRRR